MEQGNMLFTGPSGIGKTQFSLQAAKHIALGKDYLHYKIANPKKIVLLSLEMGHPDLQVFLRTQDTALTDDERDTLADNLIVIPHGEAWPLNVPGGQEQLLRIIEEYEPDGIFVDSIGSAIIGNINSQEVVQNYTNFVDSVRKKYGLFWWAIHHNRKSTIQGPKVTTQDDVYGDQYLVNRASSVYTMVPAKNSGIRLINLKQRMWSAEEHKFFRRNEVLDFEPYDPKLEVITPMNDPETPENPKAGSGLPL